jgi:hypothetical protein
MALEIPKGDPTDLDKVSVFRGKSSADLSTNTVASEQSNCAFMLARKVEPFLVVGLSFSTHIFLDAVMKAW